MCDAKLCVAMQKWCAVACLYRTSGNQKPDLLFGLFSFFFPVLKKILNISFFSAGDKNPRNQGRVYWPDELRTSSPGELWYRQEDDRVLPGSFQAHGGAGWWCRHHLAAASGNFILTNLLKNCDNLLIVLYLKKSLRVNYLSKAGVHQPSNRALESG